VSESKCAAAAELARLLILGPLLERSGPPTPDTTAEVVCASVRHERHAPGCAACRTTFDRGRQFQRDHWTWRRSIYPRDEDPIRAAIDSHVLHCADCRVDASEQLDGSWLPGFAFCRVGSALVDALDAFRWTLDGTLEFHWRHRFGLPTDDAGRKP
jgi:hypothetical protein